MADLGAEVIKIERPGAGMTRAPGGAVWDEAAGLSAYFCRRSRQVPVAVDLAAEGAALVRICGAVAILIENFKVGALQRYGLDWRPCARQSGAGVLLDHGLWAV